MTKDSSRSPAAAAIMPQDRSTGQTITSEQESQSKGQHSKGRVDVQDMARSTGHGRTWHGAA
jgi:hypothetical protein